MPLGDEGPTSSVFGFVALSVRQEAPRAKARRVDAAESGAARVAGEVPTELVGQTQPGTRS